jgi:hypothetical protein
LAADIGLGLVLVMAALMRQLVRFSCRMRSGQGLERRSAFPPTSLERRHTYALQHADRLPGVRRLRQSYRGAGVTVNAYRPGGVDTAMQTWIRRHDPGRIGAGLHERFNKNFADGLLISPEHSAAALLAHLAGDDTGAIWDVSIAPVRT